MNNHIILVSMLFGVAFAAPAPYICGRTIMITSKNKVYNYDQEHNNNNDFHIKDIIYNVNTEIKLSSRKEAVCFNVEEENINLAITLNRVEESCIDQKFMYAVPKNPKLACYSKYNTNWFNKYSDLCNKASYEEVIKTYFADKQEEKILDFSCNNEQRTFVDTSFWWMSALKIDTNMFYKVFKCLDHQREYYLDIYDINNPNNVKKDIMIRENQPFIYHYSKNITFTIDDLIISSKPFLTLGNTCLVTDEINNPLALLTKCNDDTSIVPGMFGEIKCNLNKFNMIDTQSCEVGKLLSDIRFDSYNIKTCALNTIDYNAVVEQKKLPYTEEGTYVYKQYGIVFIRRTDSSLFFNIKSKFKVSQVYYKNKCDVVSHDLDFKSVVYNVSASFNIKVFNNRPVLISFVCNDNHINIQPVQYLQEDTYENIRVKFYPVIKDIDTSCKIYCGSEEKSMFNLKGSFHNIAKIEHKNLKVDGEGYIAYPEDVSDNVFKLIGTAISEFVATIWGKITAAVSTLLIVGFIILGTCMCLGKIKCCCCFRKKNKIILDDNIINNLKQYKIKNNNKDIELQEVVSLIDEPQYFAYNGESIKIFNEEYKITPTGIVYKNKTIVHSIPHVIFYHKNFTYKDDKILFNNQIVVNKVKTSKELNSKYILDKGLVYHFDNSSKPLMMLRDHNLSDMRILDIDYTEFDDGLYLNGNPIITNIFLDI